MQKNNLHFFSQLFFFSPSGTHFPLNGHGEGSSDLLQISLNHKTVPPTCGKSGKRVSSY